MFERRLKVFFFSTIYRLQQPASNKGKKSGKIVDGDVSSCADDDDDGDDGSESEGQDDEKLPVVIVKSMFE